MSVKATVERVSTTHGERDRSGAAAMLIVLPPPNGPLGRERERRFVTGNGFKRAGNLLRKTSHSKTHAVMRTLRLENSPLDRGGIRKPP
jgi:hypothetical protein